MAAQALGCDLGDSLHARVAGVVQQTGISTRLKSELRYRLIESLNRQSLSNCRGDESLGASLHETPSRGLPLVDRAVFSLILEFLRIKDKHYSLSVLLPECGMVASDVLTHMEIGQALSLHRVPFLTSHLTGDTGSPLLVKILEALSGVQEPVRTTQAIQTDDGSVGQTLDAKLQACTAKSAAKDRRTVEERMLQFQARCEARCRREVEAEVARVRTLERERVALEEAANCRMQFQESLLRAEREAHEREQRLHARERAALERLRARELELEKRGVEWRAEAQRLLEDGRRQLEVRTRQLSLEEQRVGLRLQSLDQRERDAKEREERFEVQQVAFRTDLDLQMKSFRVEAEGALVSEREEVRRQALEVQKEKILLEGDRERHSSWKEKLAAAEKSEVEARAEARNAEQQADRSHRDLEDVRRQLCIFTDTSRQAQLTSERLRAEVSALQRELDAVRVENSAIKSVEDLRQVAATKAQAMMDAQAQTLQHENSRLLADLEVSRHNLHGCQVERDQAEQRVRAGLERAWQLERGNLQSELERLRRCQAAADEGERRMQRELRSLQQQWRESHRECEELRWNLAHESEEARRAHTRAQAAEMQARTATEAAATATAMAASRHLSLVGSQLPLKKQQEQHLPPSMPATSPFSSPRALTTQVQNAVGEAALCRAPILSQSATGSMAGCAATDAAGLNGPAPEAEPKAAEQLLPAIAQSAPPVSTLRAMEAEAKATAAAAAAVATAAVTAPMAAATVPSPREAAPTTAPTAATTVSAPHEVAPTTAPEAATTVSAPREVAPTTMSVPASSQHVPHESAPPAWLAAAQRLEEQLLAAELLGDELIPADGTSDALDGNSLLCRRSSAVALQQARLQAETRHLDGEVSAFVRQQYGIRPLWTQPDEIPMDEPLQRFAETARETFTTTAKSRVQHATSGNMETQLDNMRDYMAKVPTDDARDGKLQEQQLLRLLQLQQQHQKQQPEHSLDDVPWNTSASASSLHLAAAPDVAQRSAAIGRQPLLEEIRENPETDGPLAAKLTTPSAQPTGGALSNGLGNPDGLPTATALQMVHPPPVDNTAEQISPVVATAAAAAAAAAANEEQRASAAAAPHDGTETHTPLTGEKFALPSGQQPLADVFSDSPVDEGSVRAEPKAESVSASKPESKESVQQRAEETLFESPASKGPGQSERAGQDEEAGLRPLADTSCDNPASKGPDQLEQKAQSEETAQQHLIDMFSDGISSEGLRPAESTKVSHGLEQPQETSKPDMISECKPPFDQTSQRPLTDMFSDSPDSKGLGQAASATQPPISESRPLSEHGSLAQHAVNQTGRENETIAGATRDSAHQLNLNAMFGMDDEAAVSRSALASMKEACHPEVEISVADIDREEHIGEQTPKKPEQGSLMELLGEVSVDESVSPFSVPPQTSQAGPRSSASDEVARFDATAPQTSGTHALFRASPSRSGSSRSGRSSRGGGTIRDVVQSPAMLQVLSPQGSSSGSKSGTRSGSGRSVRHRRNQHARRDASQSSGSAMSAAAVAHRRSRQSSSASRHRSPTPSRRGTPSRSGSVASGGGSQSRTSQHRSPTPSRRGTPSRSGSIASRRGSPSRTQSHSGSAPAGRGRSRTPSKRSSRSPSLSQVSQHGGEGLAHTAISASMSRPRSDGSDSRASAPRPFSPASSKSHGRRSSGHGGGSIERGESGGGRSNSPCDNLQDATDTGGVGDQLQRAISQRLEEARAARADAPDVRQPHQHMSEPDDEDDEDLSGHESFPESDKSSDAWG